MHKLIIFSQAITSKFLRVIGNVFNKVAIIIYPITSQKKITSAIQNWKKVDGDKTLRLSYSLSQESIVFDLGGYEGQWTSDIFSMYCCNIHIFEPVEDFATNITQRFLNNHKIKVYHFALSSESRIGKIYIDKDSTSLFKKGGKEEDITIVKAIDFMKENDIYNIDLMKINIEGAEYDLLEHLIETEFIKKIKNIQIQFHDIAPRSKQRMLIIQNNLNKTHNLTYQYPLVWENWELKIT